MAERSGLTLALKQEMAGLSLSSDYQTWVAGMHRSDVYADLRRLLVDQQGMDPSRFHPFLNGLFENYQADPDCLYVSDIHRRPRRNIAQKWKVREKARGIPTYGYTNKRKSGDTYWQFGAFTHSAVGRLLSGELERVPMQSSYWQDRPSVSTACLDDIRQYLEDFQQFPIAKSKEEYEQAFSDQRDLIVKLYSSLEGVYGNFMEPLNPLKASSTTYAASLFMRSWGYAAVDYFTNPRRRCIFREMHFPAINLVEGSLPIKFGQVDGVWVESIDGIPLFNQGETLLSTQAQIIEEIGRKGIKSFDKLAQVLKKSFPNSEIALGLLEIKSLGDQLTGFLLSQRVLTGPRPDDIDQLTRYKAGGQCLLGHYGNQITLQRDEMIYILLEPPIFYFNQVTSKMIEEYLSFLNDNHEQHTQAARLRLKEAYVLQMVNQAMINSNGYSDNHPGKITQAVLF